ncbi:helix-turn-helix domain-containing protein [Streptosporangium sp. NPDC049644]|uniref:helix-turn-helix domain-containing protein n=1 Tax=Streptosporangium sp. NPDC049644 TaxID=3155507 RepID=UPI003422E053
MVDHIVSSLDGDLSPATLAARLNVSERHLTRLSLEHLGQTPGRFIRQARTQAAEQLLVSSSLSVADIAARCGFGSAESLRRLFIAEFGASPTRYRQARASAPSEGHEGPAGSSRNPSAGSRHGVASGALAGTPVVVRPLGARPGRGRPAPRARPPDRPAQVPVTAPGWRKAAP